jgi:S-disulfanyl-L-cysteine oxidoreductase SoxD
MPSRLIAVAMTGAAIVLAACDPPWHHEMARQSSLASTHSPRQPADGTLTVDGERRLDRLSAEATLRNPLGPGDTTTGRALFGIYCVPCHGVGGLGDGRVPAHFALGVKVRASDLTSAAVQAHSDGWLYATIADGTANMPAYHYELTPHERWEIVRYVRQFRSAGP